MLEQLIAQIAGQTILDWTISTTAIIYVVLAARENAWCWAWGIVSCSLWAYADFAKYNLWADGLLQVFYVGMGAWGLYNWKFGGSQKAELRISRMNMRGHFWVVFTGGLLTLAFGFVFSEYSPTALPYEDSFITAFSVLATILTVRKKLENWLYWVVVDALAVFLFSARGATLVAVVMAIYTVIAVFGFFRWRKKVV